MAANGHPGSMRQQAGIERPHPWQLFRLDPCVHGAGDLVRVHRPTLLRWFVRSRRLYRCPHCGTVVFYGR